MRTKKLLATAGLTIAALMFSPVAQAAPSLFDGHYYEFIQLDHDIAWTDARAAGLARTYSGQSGYLVNITSAAENTFVLGITPGVWTPGNPLLNDGWIGATDEITEGDWKWADGPEGGMSFWSGIHTGTLVPPFIFAGWGNTITGDGDEPNDLGGEDYAHLQGSYGWNDLPNFSKTPRRGYFVEYGDTNQLPPSVPEPATLAIFCLGLAGLGFMRRRRAARAATTPARRSTGASVMPWSIPREAALMSSRIPQASRIVMAAGRC